MEKNFTKEELAKTVKNASKNTDLAKKLVASGQIVIDPKKRYSTLAIKKNPKLFSAKFPKN